MNKRIFLTPSELTKAEIVCRRRVMIAREKELGIDKIEWYSPGVYFLSKNNVIVYIGQSINIRGRVHQHTQMSKWIDFDSVSYIPCVPEKLDKQEYKQIIKHKPRYNKKILEKFLKEIRDERSGN